MLHEMIVPVGVAALRERGLQHFSTDFAGRLKEAMGSGGVLRADYSGIGGAESALAHIVEASHELTGSSRTATSVRTEEWRRIGAQQVVVAPAFRAVRPLLHP